VTDAQGNALELSPVESSGTRLVATADRMRIGERSLLTARVHGDDLRPWVVGFEVESAAYHSDELALVTLRARSIRLDPQQRQADRTAMGGHARLIAYSCQNVVDGDVVEGSIVDVSDNGVAFMTRRLLRPGDRLSFAGRFFATVVEAEVRVARIAEVAGQLQVGCTFIAVNLAAALAQIGVKTLLVDGNLRSPSVHTYFSPELAGPGLHGCLLNPTAPVAEFTHDDVLPNLDVLIAGEPDRNSHELLAGDGFPELINVCMRDYDMTIVDTPPANSCADALRISTVVGFSLIVARKQRTLVSDVRVLADQLKKERARAIGTVMNSY